MDHNLGALKAIRTEEFYTVPRHGGSWTPTTATEASPLSQPNTWCQQTPQPLAVSGPHHLASVAT